MIWVDYVIVVVIIISAIISLMRGFIREALSLVGWFLAFWVALTFSERVAALVADQITVPSARLAVAFFALFIGVLLIAGLIMYLVGLVVEKTGASGTDRMIGMVFGVARGLVIVVLLVMAAGTTPLPRDPWWRQSLLIPHFQSAAEQMQVLLPAEMMDRFKY